MAIKFFGTVLESEPTSISPFLTCSAFSNHVQCILNVGEGILDPLQFAYKRNRGVKEAILSLLHDTYTHLDKAGYVVRILFIDYSSAVDTIQPHLLAEKLFSLNVRPQLIVWLIDFLVNRSQVFRYQNVLSQVKTTST